MINSKSYITGNNILGVFAGKYINKKRTERNEKFSGGDIHDFDNAGNAKSTNAINNEININSNINTDINSNTSNVTCDIKNEEIYNKNEFHKDNTFFDWFLNEKLLFTNAYISDNDYDYFIPPASIMYEKYHETELYELFDESAVKLLEKSTDKNSSAALKKIDGFISINNDSIKKLHVKKSLSFHHARDKRTGTAKQGDIFNYESIAENQIFKGNIICEKNILDDFVKMFGAKFHAYIGKSKNSQYGKVEIELESPQTLESWGYCPEINQSKLSLDEDDDFTILTILSNTVIYNENGFSTVNINDFEKYLNKKLKYLLSSSDNSGNDTVNVNNNNNINEYSDIKISKAFIQNDRTEEFVGIWKLKNQSENVFLAGSCFMLEGLSGDYRHYEMLKKLCVEGIGEKTHEGFGRAVCAWQNQDKKYHIVPEETAEDKKLKIKKPDGECPSFAANIIKDIIADNLLTEIKEEAMKDAHDFKNVPSKSLIGKLQLLVRTDIDGFRKKFDMIVGDDKSDKQQKKPAKVQLENSNNGKENMLDFIKNLFEDAMNKGTYKTYKNSKEKFNIGMLIDKNKGLFENLDEFIDSLKKDNNFTKDLKRTYCTTFFNFLRKNK